jgi:hypothetical protein
MFLRKFGAVMRTRAGSAPAMLEMLTDLAGRLPSQTRRSEESEHLQQFSTPITLGFVAAEAAALTSADVVLEPSAGTGLLAIFAELAKSRLALNEIADTRAGLLGRLFRGIDLTRHNAEQIHDRLDPAIRPSVVLMNPPFSASPNIEGRFAEAAMRHIASALARLAEGGRLVAITGRNVGPDQPAWHESFVHLQEKGRVVWGTGDFPFATRADFVAAMEKGGVAAMEVLARDLKALGLYAARSLSFEGIEYEILEHTLTAEQIRIYDAYADAFQIIHKNLSEALKAANITGTDGSTYNRNAKAAARSAFESNKQRFFNHLLTAMKCPTLIAAIAFGFAGHTRRRSSHRVLD